ncbi:hypothetical protein Tco_1378206 [Tanacetum coccineum]
MLRLPPSPPRHAPHHPVIITQSITSRHCHHTIIQPTPPHHLVITSSVATTTVQSPPPSPPNYHDKVTTKGAFGLTEAPKGAFGLTEAPKGAFGLTEAPKEVFGFGVNSPKGVFVSGFNSPKRVFVSLFHLSCPIHEHSTITILNGARESTVSAPKWARHTSERGTSAPPSPDYIPGPEAPPSPDYMHWPGGGTTLPPIYIPYVPEPEYPEFMPPEDHVFPAEEQPLPVVVSPTADSPGYIPESDPEEEDEEDPEEDPAYYPADIGDDDEEDEEGLHLTTTHEAAHDAMGNIARKDDDINTAEGPRSENQRAEMWESEGRKISHKEADLKSASVREFPDSLFPRILPGKTSGVATLQELRTRASLRTKFLTLGSSSPYSSRRKVVLSDVYSLQRIEQIDTQRLKNVTQLPRIVDPIRPLCRVEYLFKDRSEVGVSPVESSKKKTSFKTAFRARYGKANVVMMLELGKDREPLRFRALSDDYWLGLPINKYLNAQTEEKSWRTSRWRMLEGMLVENSKDPEKF